MSTYLTLPPNSTSLWGGAILSPGFFQEQNEPCLVNDDHMLQARLPLVKVSQIIHDIFSLERVVLIFHMFHISVVILECVTYGKP